MCRHACARETLRERASEREQARENKRGRELQRERQSGRETEREMERECVHECVRECVRVGAGVHACCVTCVPAHMRLCMERMRWGLHLPRSRHRAHGRHASRPFVYTREWPARNSLVAWGHSRTRVCRHEVNKACLTGRGRARGHVISACALEQTAAAPASVNATRARSTAPRIAERAQFRWIFPKMRAAFSARTSTGTHLP